MKSNGGSGKESTKILRRREYEELTRPLVGPLWRTAFRMTASRDVADDLVQDACLQAYIAFANYESGTNYKAWIFRILTNLCRDYLRRESRSPITDWRNEEINATVASNSENGGQPDMQLQQCELYADTIEALSCLPPGIRTVVCLSFFEGLTYQEIAVAEGIPIGTVRSRLSSGRNHLKGVLMAHAVSDDDRRPGRNARGASGNVTSSGNVTTVAPLMSSQNRRTELLK